MDKLAIPVGMVWVVFSLILGLVLVMTPVTPKSAAANAASNRTPQSATSAAVSSPTAVSEKGVNNTVKAKAFVAGTSDAVTSVSAKVVK